MYILFRKAFLLILFLFPLSLSYSQFNADITVNDLKAQIGYLASDELEGRLTGTPGAEKAARYIMEYYERAGLKPAFSNSYYQEFPFVSGLELTGNNSLAIKAENYNLNAKLNKDYVTSPFSGNFTTEGQLVFVGYGISAPKLNYDDYKGVDVKGKTVLILRYTPEPDNPRSEFEKYASYRYKISVAKEKGAEAVIFINGFFPKDDEDKLMKLSYDGAAGIDSICAVQVKREIIDSLFNSLHFNLRSIQEKINKSKSPDSFDLPGCKVKMSANIHEIIKKGKNIAGIMYGADTLLKRQYIVIGAHYDHLGYGESGSLYRGKERLIHNGADDNASGTAGVLELIGKIAGLKDKLKRSILFINFSGEELGTLGSNYFIENSPVCTDSIVAMINLDMIGRLNQDNNLIIYGVGTSKNWRDFVNNENTENYFKLTLNDDGYAPSDQTAFYIKKIPVLFFFTGTHSDYHRPTDDAEKINYSGEVEILKYVFKIAMGLDETPSKPNYVSVPRKESSGRATFRVYVGTVPDFGAQVNGFKLSGVSEGSPAQKGGLKAGDIMIKFGERKITNIYDYTYALGDHSPGDIVDVIVLRDGKELKLKVELGAR